MLTCHLLGLPALLLKCLPCLNTSSLGFIDLLCSKQSELGLGNTYTVLLISVIVFFSSVWFFFILSLFKLITACIHSSELVEHLYNHYLELFVG